MTFSVDEISSALFSRAFANLKVVLRLGEEHADAAGIPHQELLSARLAPDMLDLTAQVQRASDTSKFAVARLADVTPPVFADEEKSFAELQERIDRTVAFFATVTPAALTAGLDRMVELKKRSGTVVLSGRHYLLRQAVPNFFFHVTTAYDILRHKGVPLGKRFFIGPLED